MADYNFLEKKLKIKKLKKIKKFHGFTHVLYRYNVNFNL